MTDTLFLAVTWIGKETRFLHFDWSWLVVLGLIGNGIFSMRFLVQWVASEKKGESVIPVSFWYWSIAGSIVMAAYFICRRDPVGTIGYLPNTFIYWRNLRLVRRKRLAATAAAQSQTPREES